MVLGDGGEAHLKAPAVDGEVEVGLRSHVECCEVVDLEVPVSFV